MESLERRILDLLARDGRVVLVTIVDSLGSAPRHTGTRALQTKTGFEGTVGGGILEAETMALAAQAFQDGQSKRARFSMTPDASSDMVCGGSLEVFCEVLGVGDFGLFKQACACLEEGRRGLWCVEDKFKRIFLDTDDPEFGKLWARCQGQAKLMDQMYVEPIKARPVILLCGAGHVSLEVAKIAARCDFVLDVVDDRQEFANASRFPMARRCYVLPEFQDLVAKCQIGSQHYVAIMTRGHKYDFEVLQQVIAIPVYYLGMIGSKQKREHIYKKLLALGVSSDQLAKVSCPIGLPIKAETPAEIAIAVMAELLAARGQVLASLRTN